MTTDQMLAFENKIFGIVIFPFNLQKEFLMHLMRGLEQMDQFWRVLTLAQYTEQPQLLPIFCLFSFILCINFRFEMHKLH